MKYLVAMPIPEPHSAMLASLQDQLQPASWRKTISPHITLLAPDQPLLDPDAAADAFMSIPRKITAFIVTASHIEVFNRRGYHTLVLAAEPLAQLTSLFHELVTCANWQQTTASTRRPFTPHITIANGLSGDQLNVAQAELSPAPPDIQFKTRELALYCKQAQWPRWKTLARHSIFA